jgi:hypothetical protein
MGNVQVTAVDPRSVLNRKQVPRTHKTGATRPLFNPPKDWLKTQLLWDEDSPSPPPKPRNQKMKKNKSRSSRSTTK